MDLALMSLQKFLTDKLLVTCPKTGEQMPAANFTFKTVTDDTDEVVALWYCSSCQDWHVAVYKPNGSKD